ncbi:MAG TPA: energy-coupling factor transporter transmembrane component T [Candidatus Eisenbacteria bacterium]|nr:energy-coupling factor transporter transmembrane component T [Candidatus Eisenbacteria bacterium]
MTLSLYVPTPSPLHRLHPVTKLAGLVALVLAAFVVDAPAYLLPLGAIVGVLLVVADALPVVRRFRTLFVVVFVFTLVVWTFFFKTVFVPTRAGFEFGLSTAIRLDTFLATGLLFLATTRVEEIAYALGRLGVPYKIGFVLTLAFRLVPLFFDAAGTIVQAQRCRGLRMDEGGVIVRLRRFVPVIVPVFVGALRRADRMAMALELRGFNSGRPRTTYLRARPARRDLVAGLAALGVMVSYLALWAHGLGVLAR